MNFKKKSFVFVLISLAIFFSGCDFINSSNFGRSNIERLDPVVGLIPLGVGQNSITEYHIVGGTYIKDVQIVLGGSCKNNWIEKDKFRYEGDDARVCIFFNGDGTNDNDLNIPKNSISEREIAANTYIKDISIDDEDCEEGWIERSYFIAGSSGGGCSVEKGIRYNICVLYNGDGDELRDSNLPLNSITEYHIKDGLMWEDIAITDSDCNDYGEGWELEEDLFFGEIEDCSPNIFEQLLSGIPFIGGLLSGGNSCQQIDLAENINFELCVDKTDDDTIGVEGLCTTNTIDKSELNIGSGNAYCLAQDEICYDVSCSSEGENDIIRCLRVDCEYSSYTNINDGVKLDVTCCSETPNDLPRELGVECIDNEVSDGRSFDSLRNECVAICSQLGEDFGWNNEQINTCKQSVLDRISELDMGLSDIPIPYGGEGISRESSEACAALSIDTGQPVDQCLGCCGVATGVAQCCFQDVSGFSGCQIRPQESIFVEGLGDIVLQYTSNVDKFKVWLEVEFADNIPIRGYEVEARRITDSNEFTFIERSGREWSVVSDLALSCGEIILSIVETNRCVVKSNELPIALNSVRISCDPGYAIAGIIRENINDYSEKEDIKAVCCPLVASFRE